MVRRGAPRPDERADAQDPDAQVVLEGVADRAVHLQGGAGREVGSVGRRHLRGGHVPGARTAPALELAAQRPWTSGRAKSRATRTSARRVLDRLVLPDDPAELAALTDVRDGLASIRSTGAEQARRAGQGGQVEGACHRRRRASVEGEPSTSTLCSRRDGSTDESSRVERAGRERPPRRARNDVGRRRCAVEGVRRLRRSRDRDADRSLGEVAEKPLVRRAGEEGRRERGRLDPRPGDTVVAEPLEGHREVQRSASDAARTPRAR